METKVALTAGDVLTRISAALDSADHEFGLMTDAALLGATTSALALADRMHAFALSLLADIESKDTPTTNSESARVAGSPIAHG